MRGPTSKIPSSRAGMRAGCFVMRSYEYSFWRHFCCASSCLYRDNDFPADETSVGATTQELNIYWRRGSALNQSGVKNTM